MANVSIDGGNEWGNLGREDGGNCAKGRGEAHGGGSAKNIAQDNYSGNPGSEGSMKGSFGPTRQSGDGNKPVSGEKHNSKKSDRILDLGRSKGNMDDSVPTRIQVDGGDRGPSGNYRGGKKEPTDSKKAMRVSQGLDRL